MTCTLTDFENLTHSAALMNLSHAKQLGGSYETNISTDSESDSASCRFSLNSSEPPTKSHVRQSEKVIYNKSSTVIVEYAIRDSNATHRDLQQLQLSLSIGKNDKEVAQVANFQLCIAQ